VHRRWILSAIGGSCDTFPGMNRKLTLVAAGRGGWFNRADARACGYTESEIRERLRVGRWRRLCRDGYVEAAAEPAAETPWDRGARLHRLTAAAVLHRMGGTAVVSHQSALVLHGLPVWGLSLDRVHVTKPTGRWRSSAELVVHRARIEPNDVVGAGELRVMSAARAAVEAACGSSYHAAVVLFDTVLHQGVVSRTDIEALVQRLRHRTGSPRARNALAFADGRSESVGESRLRTLMADYGLPTPDLQVELFDHEERSFIGRVDFLFRDQGVVVEFDGESKYANAGDLVAEKRREDRIRRVGYSVIRLAWADLDRPVRTTRLISDALLRAAA
jgi:Transcriptional regulator, AbiEi antitoxin